METIVNRLFNIEKELQKGNIKMLTNEEIIFINEITTALLISREHSVMQITQMGIIVKISNILYNNTDRIILPLEDGVYDLLSVLYKRYNPNYQVGAEPISFEASKNISIVDKIDKLINPIIKMDEDIIMNSLFIADDLMITPDMTLDDMLITPIVFGENIEKRIINTPHIYPELVGTLDKCKFVLNSQAIERGVFDDSNVQIFERDFIQKHLELGIIYPNETFTMIAELKYDGISIEAEVSNKIHSARSRGDTNNDIATDLTPILGGYRFKHANGIPDDEIFGMKFEAIMDKHDLQRISIVRNKEYKNCRNAIIGLFSSSNAALYKDYITLIPLATSLHLDRVEEIEFMNKFYHSGEYLRYAVLEGTYIEILFQVKRFLEEAEYMREAMPFLYDGIVISYRDNEKIEKLGRENSVNKYSMAIKFNPIKKQTIFTGYLYSVGQDGVITPMIFYNPVEFYGTIHNKSSGHSFARFKELNLAIGDIIDVEYVNDVMPYVTKPDNSYNAYNSASPEEFISTCPSCNTILKISESGKSMICTNMYCPERNIARMTSMLQKLNLKDFSEETLKEINTVSLSELFSLTKKDVEQLGPNNSQLFIDRINDLKNNPIYDYQIIGALGFTGIAIEKWKLILNKISISDIVNLNDQELKMKLVKVKGIGPTTSDIICNEREFFKNDLNTILGMQNLKYSIGVKFGKNIRYTGVRDKKLTEYLNGMGHNVSEASGITKSTDILLIPEEGFTNEKTRSVGPYTIIIPISEFKNNMNKYL